MTGGAVPADPPGRPRRGPSDPGLAGERTTLAWARIGLSLLALPGGILAYAAGRDWLAALAAAFAAILGVGVLTVSLRRQRAAEGMVEVRSLVLASEQVVLTATSVVLLGLSCLVLVNS